MKVAFIGAGKVATVFGWYLKSKGLELLGYYSKSLESAQKAALATNSQVAPLEELVTHSDVIFITTPDSNIEKVCEDICDQFTLRDNQTMIHMSGALKSDILVKAKEKGASIFSLHPMQSFADPQKAKEDIKNTFFTFEGQGDKKNLINILEKIENPYREIKPEDKLIYHAAASISSNYLVTLTKLATQLFEQIGFKEEDALQVLTPLMQGTIKNIEQLGVDKALTGPIVRGDAATIKGHLEGLQGQETVKTIYCSLGKETLKIAKNRGLNKEYIDSITNLLDGSEGNG